MSTLIRTSELAKLPVVTFAGEAIAQIKDIVYGGDGGEVYAFTLAGRGLFSGPRKDGVPWAHVIGLGPDALIIESEQALVPITDLQQQAAASGTGVAGDVLGSQVLTDTGVAIGIVTDVVLGLRTAGPVQGSGQADVVGYQINPVESLGRGSEPLLIPLPDTLSASGTHLVVPASVTGFMIDDIQQFGAAVDAFRQQLGSNASAPAASAQIPPAAAQQIPAAAPQQMGEQG